MNDINFYFGIIIMYLSGVVTGTGLRLIFKRKKPIETTTKSTKNGIVYKLEIQYVPKNKSDEQEFIDKIVALQKTLGEGAHD